MIRLLYGVLAVSVAICLTHGKQVALVDNDHSSGNYMELDSNENNHPVSFIGPDEDVINFCQICKTYIDLYKQADDTIEIKLPGIEICDDIVDNDENICANSIANLGKLADLENVAAADSQQVCRIVGLCEEEEELSSDNNEIIDETGGSSKPESYEKENLVENLLLNSTHQHHHLQQPLNNSHPNVHDGHNHHPHSSHHINSHYPNHKQHKHNNIAPHRRNGANSNKVFSAGFILFIAMFLCNNSRSI